MERSLDPELQQICIEITKKLRKYPAAKLFNDPVDPKKEGVPDYFKKIKNPQDLGSIYQRLEAGEYTSVEQWERDINTVWTNAEIYHGKSNEGYIPVICAARYMSSRFQRLKKSLLLRSVTGWTKQLYNLRQEFDELLKVCPPSLQNIIPKSLDSAVNTLVPFTSRDLSNFMKASQLVNQPKDIEQIVAILKKNDPSMDIDAHELIIDVNSMNIQSLHEIRAYYRKQLIERGVAYPNDANEHVL